MTEAAAESACPAAPSIISSFLASVEKGPDRAAISYYDERWTYRELRDRSFRYGCSLPESGIALIFLPQGAEAIAVYLGAMWAGCVPSFMPLPSVKQDPELYWRSHLALLDLIEPAVIVTDAPSRARMRAAGIDRRIVSTDDLTGGPRQLRPGGGSAIALLQHSSGTTALKKGVALSHEAVVRQVKSYAMALDVGPDDAVASWLPLYHDMGLIAGTIMPLMLGQSIVLLDPFKWSANPASLFEAITRHRATLCWLPNFAFEHMVRTVRPDPARFDLASMRSFINCSEPCKPATFQRFADRFSGIGVRPAMLQVSYAMAETVFAVTQTQPGERPRHIVVESGTLRHEGTVEEVPDGLSLQSCGPTIAGACLCIVDSDGAELPERRLGEIVVEAEFLFDGYYNRPELSARALAGKRYRTNDLGFLDSGELFVLGRKDDLIIVHGRNYFAHEIEAVVGRVAHLKPGRAVALPIFNPAVGSEDAVVVAESSTSLAPDMAQEIRRVARQAILQDIALEVRDVVIVEPGWLVKTTSGKISRSANKEKYERLFT